MTCFQLIERVKQRRIKIPRKYLVSRVADIFQNRSDDEELCSDITSGFADLIAQIDKYEQWLQAGDTFSITLDKMLPYWLKRLTQLKYRNYNISAGSMRLVDIWCYLVALYIKEKGDDNFDKNLTASLESFGNRMFSEVSTILSILESLYRIPGRLDGVSCTDNFKNQLLGLKKLSTRVNVQNFLNIVKEKIKTVLNNTRSRTVSYNFSEFLEILDKERPIDDSGSDNGSHNKPPTQPLRK